MNGLSIGNDVGVGYAVGGASEGAGYAATLHGVAETGNGGVETLGCGREANSALWIESGIESDPSWGCPSLQRHGCRQSHPVTR